MNQEVQARLRVAQETLREAERLFEASFLRGATSRAYYAMFYAATAMLASHGEKYSSHEAVKARFGEVFSKPRVVDPKFHRFLLDGFELRHEADYEIDLQKPLAYEDVERTLRNASEFVSMAEQFVKGEGQ